MNATARGERRAERLNDPRFDRFRTTGARRRLVVAMVALLVAEAGILLWFGASSSTPLSSTAVFVLFGVLVLGFVGCFGTLKASTRGVEELSPDLLDERQQQVRGLVYARAYRVGSTLVIGLLAAIVLAANVLDAPPPSGVITAVLVLVFHVTLVLPTLVAGWHERV